MIFIYLKKLRHRVFPELSTKWYQRWVHGSFGGQMVARGQQPERDIHDLEMDELRRQIQELQESLE